MPSIYPDNIPQDLKDRAQWVVWLAEKRGDKTTKVPYNPTTGEHASSTSPATWATFDTAWTRYQSGGIDGIGYVFSADDPYCGIDLDHCADDDGNATQEAIHIIQHLSSYTELSPSGKGAHIIVKAKLPPEGRRKGSIEMYDSGRYFTMTGNHWEGTPITVKDRQAELTQLHTKLFLSQPVRVNEGATPMPVHLEDAAIIERARRAKNGADFDRLWNGNASAYHKDDGTPDASAADMALANHLAFWTGGDPSRVDSLFRRSGLMRDKWDERHYADGRTYGQETVDKAIRNSTSFFGQAAPPPVLTILNGSKPEATDGDGADTEHDYPADCPLLPDSATAIYDHAAPCGKWLDDYIAFASVASPMTPRSFHEAAGLFAGATAIARRAVLRVSTTSIYPNLFCLFIAPSTLYSKTTGLRLLTDLFSAADMQHFLLPQRMTPEAMLQELSLGVPGNLNMGDQDARAQWLHERALAAKRGWAIDEASGLFDSLKRDFNTGLLPMLLNLYECPDRMTEQTIGRWRVTVHKAGVSFFGAATPASMSEHLANTTLWSNGLWARFALVTPDQAPSFEFFPSPMAIPPYLIHGLQRLANLFPMPAARLIDVEDPDGTKRKAVEVEGEDEPHHVTLAKGVWEAWEAYTRATRYDLLKSGGVNQELLYASYGRLGTHAIKVAMILAALDTNTLPVTVELRHYARAQSIVETWRTSIHRLRSTSATRTEENNADKMVQLLTQAGPAGLPTRELYRPLHLTSAEGYHILESLERQGDIQRYYSVAKNGRKVEMWTRSSLAAGVDKSAQSAIGAI
jgi:putative DNA primase/helicase